MKAATVTVTVTVTEEDGADSLTELACLQKLVRDG